MELEITFTSGKTGEDTNIVIDLNSALEDNEFYSLEEFTKSNFDRRKEMMTEIINYAIIENPNFDFIENEENNEYELYLNGIYLMSGNGNYEGNEMLLAEHSYNQTIVDNFLKQQFSAKPPTP